LQKFKFVKMLLKKWHAFVASLAAMVLVRPFDDNVLHQVVYQSLQLFENATLYLIGSVGIALLYLYQQQSEV